MVVSDTEIETQEELGGRAQVLVDATFSMECKTLFVRNAWESWAGMESHAKDFDVSYASVLNDAKQLSLFVDIDPIVLGGSPRIRQTRIPVYGILNAIEEYGSIDSAVTAYRSLTVDIVKDALRFAANVLESPLEHENPDLD